MTTGKVSKVKPLYCTVLILIRNDTNISIDILIKLKTHKWQLHIGSSVWFFTISVSSLWMHSFWRAIFYVNLFGCVFIYICWKIFKGINQVAIRFVNVLAWLVEFRMRDVSDLYLLMSLLLTKNSFRYGVFRPDI